MEYHEYANLFPMMPAADLKSLADDIRSSGLSDSIITFEGKILDGRNRHKACEIAGITPRFTEYDGSDALQFVISHNLHRRHLTESQRAMVAAKWAKLKHGGERGNQHTGGKSPIGDLANQQTETKTRDEAAKLLNVGTSSIDRAKKVINKAPELVEKIESGEMSVNAAYVSTKKPTDQPNGDFPAMVALTPTAAGNRRAFTKIIEDEGMNIWLLAKSHLDRINKHDTQRVKALTACAEYCAKRLQSKK